MYKFPGGFNMSYIMFIQNGGSIGHTEFEEYAQAYSTMKAMVADHIGVSSEMLDNMMDESGDGPFFYVHRTHAYVDAQGADGILAIRLEEVVQPLAAYAELSMEKTGVTLTLIDQFYTALDACKSKQEDMEMDPMGVLPLIGQLKGSYKALQAIGFTLDEETEHEYQKFCEALHFYLGE